MNIRKINGKWAYDFAKDKKRYRKGGFKTKAEAKHAGNTAYNEAVKGSGVDENKTFSEYYKEWYAANGKEHLSDKQKEWYNRAFNIVNDYLGADMALKKFNRQTYQKLLNDYGRGRSDGSVKKLKGVLSQIFRDAAYDGYIDRDPTYKIKVSGTAPSKKESDKYIKVQEYIDLIEYFKSRNEKSYILLYIIAITGGRFSEVNNLKVEDLQLNSIHLPGTKTITSDRIVEVNTKDLTMIKDKLSKHVRRMDGYLFKLSNNAALKSLRHAMKSIGVSGEQNITTYVLRHTHCSYLISQGVSIEYISKRLGHADISTTHKFYAHLLDEHRNEQAEKVRNLFS